MTRQRILIVDDEIPLTGVVQSRLEAVGYETDVAHAGEEALLKARAFVPDLVISNRNMPGIKGEELASRFLAEGIKTRLILATGQHSEAIFAEFYRVGGCDVLVKPFRLQDLEAAIRRHVNDPKEINFDLADKRSGRAEQSNSRS